MRKEIEKLDEEFKDKVFHSGESTMEIIHSRDRQLLELVKKEIREISMEGYGYPDPDHYKHVKRMFNDLKDKAISVIDGIKEDMK